MLYKLLGRRTAPFSFLFASFLVLLASCGNDPLKIDVSGVNIPEVTINRLEQDLFKMDTSNISSSTEKLKSKYGTFYSTFISGIINNGNLRDSSYSFRIKQFISDPDMKKAYEDTQAEYPDLNELKEELSDAEKHFAYYFPGRALPKTVTMMSGFNVPVVATDSTLAIGLEMYLGGDNEFYRMLTFPHYKTMFMNRQNIVPDAVRIWMLSEFPYTMDQSDFLSQIVYMGKIMYLSDALLPEVHDTIKMQYSGMQMEYCTQNEFNIWSYFAAQKLLYTTDQAEIMKYTSDGPFTSALSKESAPRIGYWIGLQIVRQYMLHNPGLTPEQLMKETNAQKILTKAKYKPK
jgi:hypothetical protein